MRRSTILLIAALSSFSLVGCEDGPNQTYSPAPAGAGDLFNDGKTGPSIDPGKADLGASFPGKSRQEVCSSEEKRAVWARMLSAPIEPPRKYAQIDMAGSDNWEGLTVEAAEKVNCQSTSEGDGAVHWGDNAEVEFFYDVGTHIVQQMQLNIGYAGKMTMKGRQPGGLDCYNYNDPNNVVVDPTCPHKGDTYEIGVGSVFKKNGKPFMINWEVGGGTEKEEHSSITELYDAAIATFSPSTKPDADCKVSRACLDLGDGGDGTAIFGFRPLAVYFIMRQYVANPLPSTPFVIYNFFVKSEPYSNAPMELKLDAEGPVAAAVLGPNNKNCAIRLGTTFQEFTDNCVNVSGDASIDKQNYAKLIGGRVHSFDDIYFNVVGVNNNFTLKKDRFDVVKDSDLPAADDRVTEWIFDVRAKGAVANDLDVDGVSDQHGTGLVYREFARLAQNAIYDALGTPALSRRKLGDAACLSATPAANCTGLEGIQIPGPLLGAGTGWDDLDAITWGLDSDGFSAPPYDSSSLTPGDPKLLFGDGDYGSLWDTAYRHVIKVMGNGDVFRLPSDVRDRRFFFRHYSIALVKYMKAYGVKRATTTPADVANQQLDMENIFFEVSDFDSYDKVEYIDREFVDATHEPTNFDYGTDVKVGNQRETKWDRKMSRPERALYQAMLPDTTSPLGKIDNVRLTNMFGSPILTANWESAQCAAGPAPCRGNAAPYAELDSDGLPLALDYKGSWGASIFHQGDSPVEIFGLLPDIQGAKVRLPHFADVYDLTSPVLETVEVLVPHLPKQPGVGFPVPLSGTRDKFVTSGNLDFEGNTSTYEIKYDWQTCGIVQGGTACTGGNAGKAQYVCNAGTTPAKADLSADTSCVAVDSTKKDIYCCTGSHPDTVQTMSIRVLAIDSRDFLGDVFVCQDPATMEILRARMYDSGQAILDWFNNHPGSVDACDVIVRFAPFNNYIDKIFARANGVTLDISKSQASGRVDDALLWDPVLVSQ